MGPCVKSIKVTYNPLNERNTFTNGDWITGQVTLDVGKDCQIDSLFIKFKAKADVLWTERYGQTTVVYHAKDKYFSLRHDFIRNRNLRDGNQTLLRNQYGETYSSVVAPGCHVYPFTFQIPFVNTPSSFKGSVGKIVYLLEARLSRSLRITKKDSAYINFVSRIDPNTIPQLMIPQHESKDKKMKVFSSGAISMDVNIEKTGFVQGEGIQILACIQNNSSREVKPKYCIYRKHSFFAKGRRKLSTKDLLKEVGESILPSTNRKVTRVITVPNDVEPSILNCNIIKVEYRLRVYLDVKFASNPEIKFDIVILPASQVPAVAPPLVPTDFGFEPFGNPNPPVWGFVPPPAAAAAAAATAAAAPAPQLFDAPPPYEAHVMYPPLTDFGTKYQ